MFRFVFVAVAAVLATAPAAAQTSVESPGQPAFSLSTQTAQNLKRLSIEELAELDITSVSRRVERLSDVAAAVSVIRTEDIRRSGVTTLADAMRLADAVDVARTNSGTWAVTARGFNISTANKLLVLIDGRSVYSPLFSGTFWDVQDQVFEDIDRIEVIRGPGGATWGANAMNGVINIISKDAADTRGSVAQIAAGTDDHAIVSARHGDRLGASGNYRVYGKFRRRAGGDLFGTDRRAENARTGGQAGFRLESDRSRASRWFVQGDLYRTAMGLLDRPDGDLAGGNMLGRWSRRFSSTSEFQAQAYFDRTWRRIPEQFEETRNTVEVDTQHRMQPRARHDLVFGGAVRISHGNDRGAAGFFFEPQSRTNDLFSVFAQDEITVRPRVFLTLGSKIERNDYTGFEVQPTARIRWTRPNARTLWAAVSRAVRLPTRLDSDLRIVDPVTRHVLITGTEDFRSESVVAYEGGYRVRAHPRVALDVAAYVNRYDDLRSQEFRPGQPVRLQNLLNAITTGVEVAATVHAADNWRLRSSYAHLQSDFSADSGSTDVSNGAVEANDPAHLFSLRSNADLPGGFQLDAVFRAVSRRPNPEVAAYAEMDLRLGWLVRPGWELSLVGQNLLHARHTEQFSINAPRYEFRRAAYIRSLWRF